MKYLMRLFASATTAVLLTMTAWASDDSVSVEAMPPVVIKTVPAAGATDVDSSLREITVTFSKEMMEGSFSACNVTEQSFPKLTGDLHYQSDKRTCVLPVRLEPGKAYAIWFNFGAKYTHFQDTSRKSAVPYLLVFETR